MSAEEQFMQPAMKRIEEKVDALQGSVGGVKDEVSALRATVDSLQEKLDNILELLTPGAAGGGLAAARRFRGQALHSAVDVPASPPKLCDVPDTPVSPGDRRCGRVVSFQEEGTCEYVAQRDTRFADVLERGVLAVIRASYFERCLEQKRRFEHRAEIPEEAIYHGREAAERWYHKGFKSLMIVSYPWLSREHPDPDLFHLPSVVVAIKAMRTRWQEDPGIILDYCSFWQGDRSPEQELQFKECLNVINIPYGHRDVTALKLTRTPAEELRGYDDRGWTKFESDVIDAKSQSPKDPYGELNVLTFTMPPGPWLTAAFSVLSHSKRRPPVTPERFELELKERGQKAQEKGVDLFTNGKDQPFILDKYREAFFAAAEGAEALDYTNMEWGPAEAKILSEALPHHKRVKKLRLGGNNFKKAGLEILAPAIAELNDLKILRLDGNSFGKACVDILRPVLAKLGELLEVRLGGNGLSQAHREALLSHAASKNLYVSI
uniref:Uncharacterized protein n=1 Tax=Alexandrium monilatum TaxID=311494 RepID=A0A7S4UYR3_9DINO|mmetsp:Transcript_79723/g.252019  ORF Transcript_79723/g.252019 Transcript_79723/m.252019 type:complete len:492 (+) Transcript_79723:85-1560(+)